MKKSKYDNYFGHYYHHEKRGVIYDGNNKEYEITKTGIKHFSMKPIYDKKVTEKTWKRNLEKLWNK